MNKKVVGQTYSSNITKLLKHLDTLQCLQRGIVKPIMVHVALTNVCNLKCSFCCFANRKKSGYVDFEKLKIGIDGFKYLGTNALELTGGGEPALYPFLNETIDYCYDLGFSLGMCTNGYFLRKVKDWNKFKWVRIGMYCIDNNYSIDLDYVRNSQVEISSAYVWDNPDINKFKKMLEFVNENKIPTRIAVNAIKDPVLIEKDMETVKKQSYGLLGQYAFLSDFNLKTTRRNNNCYIHMIKPFVFTDGNVYACPSSELAVENDFNMNEKFKLCSLENVYEFYKSLKPEAKKFNCSFCKYSQQNELIEDVLMETKHNEFV